MNRLAIFGVQSAKLSSGPFIHFFKLIKNKERFLHYNIKGKNLKNSAKEVKLAWYVIRYATGSFLPDNLFTKHIQRLILYVWSLMCSTS